MTRQTWRWNDLKRELSRTGHGLVALLAALITLVACGSAPPAGTSQPAAAPSTISNTAQARPSAPAPDEQLNVLFIGNSLTFFNDMPATFAALAASGGHQVKVALSVFPGFSLEQHSVDDRTAARLEEQDCDYVVLQEQSAIPAIQEQRDQHMFPAVRQLAARIQAQGAEPILFMTWGARDGYPKAGYGDYHATQEALRASYTGIADELGAGVAPVGLAWQHALEKDPGLGLWVHDGIHPNVAGSYLAASVFYAVFLGESPEGLTYTGGEALDPATARFLRTIAAETVLANPAEWNLAR